MNVSTRGGRQRKQLGPFGVGVAACGGTMIEWYDFYAYSVCAALVFGPLFFPAGDPLTSSLISFATIGVGFLARPVGGLVFSHFGDRIGRKNTTIVSLLLMGAATVLIGFLPTYDDVGVLAPVLLVALRFVQGMSVGGEWGGAVLLAVESAPPERRSFYGAFPQFGIPLGLIVSSFVVFVTQRLLGEAFEDWGWRVPFLFSSALIVLGLVLRTRIADPHRNTDETTERRLPLIKVLTEHPRAILVGLCFTFIGHAVYIVITFLPSYAATEWGLGNSMAANALLIATPFGLLTLIVSSLFIERIGVRKLIALGAALEALWALPAFLLAREYGAVGLVVALIVGYSVIMLQAVALPAALSKQFPAQVRYTGITLCYQLSAILGGGLLPMATSWAVGTANGHFWPAALFLFLAGLLSAAATPFARFSGWGPGASVRARSSHE